MQRHFTVTAFVSAEGATLLHWHAKNRMWLPPGGHIERDEDPLEAVLREAREETGLAVQVLTTVEGFGYGSPRQLPAPATIMVEPIAAAGGEAAHEHLDLIYFTRPVEPGRADVGARLGAAGAPAGWRWVEAEALRADVALPLPLPLPLPGGSLPEGQAEGGARALRVPEVARVPEDVRVLGLAAIARAAESR